jgi:hypothetical protein
MWRWSRRAGYPQPANTGRWRQTASRPLVGQSCVGTAAHLGGRTADVKGASWCSQHTLTRSVSIVLRNERRLNLPMSG